MIDYNRFQLKLTEDLIKSFPEKDPAYIKSFVKEIIRVEARFISKDTVASYYGLCKRCGVCCENCPELKGTLCGIYPRRQEICRLWPYYEIPGETHGIQFDPDCPYAYKTVYIEAYKILKRNKK